eukprot:scaffold783_cov197-Alexandrium_tamarense.AAC.12
MMYLLWILLCLSSSLSIVGIGSGRVDGREEMKRSGRLVSSLLFARGETGTGKRTESGSYFAEFFAHVFDVDMLRPKLVSHPNAFGRTQTHTGGVDILTGTNPVHITAHRRLHHNICKNILALDLGFWPLMAYLWHRKSSCYDMQLDNQPNHILMPMILVPLILPYYRYPGFYLAHNIHYDGV